MGHLCQRRQQLADLVLTQGQAGRPQVALCHPVSQFDRLSQGQDDASGEQPGQERDQRQRQYAQAAQQGAAGLVLELGLPDCGIRLFFLVGLQLMQGSGIGLEQGAHFRIDQLLNLQDLPDVFQLEHFLTYLLIGLALRAKRRQQRLLGRIGRQRAQALFQVVDSLLAGCRLALKIIRDFQAVALGNGQGARAISRTAPSRLEAS